MKNTISYSHIPEGPSRMAAALEDAREFIGPDERFNTICRGLAQIAEREQALSALSFAGIEGLPAEALWRFSRSLS